MIPEQMLRQIAAADWKTQYIDRSGAIQSRCSLGTVVVLISRFIKNDFIRNTLNRFCGVDMRTTAINVDKAMTSYLQTTTPDQALIENAGKNFEALVIKYNDRRKTENPIVFDLQKFLVPAAPLADAQPQLDTASHPDTSAVDESSDSHETDGTSHSDTIPVFDFDDSDEIGGTSSSDDSSYVSSDADESIVVDEEAPVEEVFVNPADTNAPIAPPVSPSTPGSHGTTDARTNSGKVSVSLPMDPEEETTETQPAVLNQIKKLKNETTTGSDSEGSDFSSGVRRSLRRRANVSYDRPSEINSKKNK